MPPFHIQTVSCSCRSVERLLTQDYHIKHNMSTNTFRSKTLRKIAAAFRPPLVCWRRGRRPDVPSARQRRAGKRIPTPMTWSPVRNDRETGRRFHRPVLQLCGVVVAAVLLPAADEGYQSFSEPAQFCGYSLMASRSSRKSPSAVRIIPAMVKNSPTPSNALPAITRAK